MSAALRVRRPFGCTALMAVASIAALASPVCAQQTGAVPIPGQAAASDTATDDSVGVGEIVVTAQKRGENVQRVPIAITALSADTLREKGISNLRDVIQATPNLYQTPYPSQGNATLNLFMRGMGAGDPAQITKDNAIGFYENGIYNPRPQQPIFDLLDAERVEILRGPQGTLYGRNTTGGAVNIISRSPSGEFGLRQVTSYASRNQYRSVTNLNLPEFADIRIKGTLAIGGDSGYQHNIHDPSVSDSDNDFGIERHVAGRIAARWQPGGNVTVDYSFDMGKVISTPFLFVAPAQNGLQIIPGLTYNAPSDRPYRPVSLPLSRTTFRNHALTLEWQPTDNLTLRSLTGLRRLHLNTYWDSVESYGIPIISTNDVQSNMVSQEFQAVGNAWDDRIKYAAGLYYFRERVSHDVAFLVGGPPALYEIDARSVSKAAYAQLTLSPPVLSDRLDLTVGARGTDDRRRASRDFSFAGTALEQDIQNNQHFKRFNPAFTASFRWNDAINSYAKIATGYRAGGSSETSIDFTRTFGPESLVSYEVGLKAEFFDRRLRTTVAAFYNRYKDIQLDLTIDPLNPTAVATLNAGRGSLKGVEVDVTAAVTPDFIVNVNYAYLKADITEVRASPGAPNVADLFLLPYAPKHSLNVSADFTPVRFPDGKLVLHVDYIYKSSVFGSSGAGPGVPGYLFYRLPGYSEINARVALERRLFGKPMTVAIFARNLLDSRHLSYRSAVGAQSSGFFYSNEIYAAPRTVGVEVAFVL